MAKLKILLYKIYRSKILLFMWIGIFIAELWLPELAISYIFLISHILLGMYFKRNELTPVQYGIRIGLILAAAGDFVIKIVN